MRYLLDTHIVIWAMVGSAKLPDAVRAILEDSTNLFYVSAVSIWETAIKHAIKPQEIPVTSKQMVKFCKSSGITELPIRFEHSLKVADLPMRHNDPFDRMLVAQAEVENLRLLTHDGKLAAYGEFVFPV